MTTKSLAIAIAFLCANFVAMPLAIAIPSILFEPRTGNVKIANDLDQTVDLISIAVISPTATILPQMPGAIPGASEIGSPSTSLSYSPVPPGVYDLGNIVPPFHRPSVISISFVRDFANFISIESGDVITIPEPASLPIAVALTLGFAAVRRRRPRSGNKLHGR